MADLMFPKDQPKKKRKKHGKSIMPAYGGCWLCRYMDDDDRPKVTEVHHIYFGPNREKSEEYGFTTDLCISHHRTGLNAVHKNRTTCRILQSECQEIFERTHSRKEFMRIIGKSYLS